MFLKTGIVLTIVFLQPVISTFSDFEGSVIPIQKDKLSWPQIGAIKTVFLLLVLMWLHGVLPLKIQVPLHHLVGRNNNDRTQNFISEVLIQVEEYDEYLKGLQKRIGKIKPDRDKAHHIRSHSNGRTQGQRYYGEKQLLYKWTKLHKRRK